MALAARARAAASAGLRPWRRHDRTRGRASSMTMRRAPTILDSFNFAFEGIIHVLRTQRNLRIHFAVAVAVLILALIVDVTKMELIALL
ncbi:MAG: diacylglycerol kinase, partial [Gaiellaceae bacterium]